MNTELLNSAFEVVAEGVESGALPSGVLAVANRRETLRVEAYGPVNAETVFLLASITKPIFCTALMRLVERGKVRLNDPVTRLIPEFESGGKGEVKVWHLLTHTSGLDESSIAAQLWAGRGEREELQRAALDASLAFQPGSRYQYCNVSFAVMAELIRRASGQNDVDYLRENVLAPLGMADTSYRPGDWERTAPVHTAPWGEDEMARERWCALAIPAGGIWSTAADLVRFGQAFLNGGNGVLAPATLREMTALQTEGIEEHSATGRGRAYYGLGFAKAGPHGSRGPSGELRTPAGFGHGGATGTSLWIEPELDLVFVFLTNKWGIDVPHASLALNAAIAAAS